jgi:mRNA interferase HigB
MIELESSLKALKCALSRAGLSRTFGTSAELKAEFPKADIVNSERVVFDICGGNYRPIVAVKYTAKIVWVKFIGTHAAYDKVDASSVSDF